MGACGSSTSLFSKIWQETQVSRFFSLGKLGLYGAAATMTEDASSNRSF